LKKTVLLNWLARPTKSKVKKTKVRFDDDFRPVLSPMGYQTPDDSILSSPPKRKLAETHKIEDGGNPPKNHIEDDGF